MFKKFLKIINKIFEMVKKPPELRKKWDKLEKNY